jgi:hypothetical protein
MQAYSLFFTQGTYGELIPENYLSRSPARDDTDQDHYYREHKQNMDEPAHGVTAHQP